MFAASRHQCLVSDSDGGRIRQARKQVKSLETGNVIIPSSETVCWAEPVSQRGTGANCSRMNERCSDSSLPPPSSSRQSAIAYYTAYRRGDRRRATLMMSNVSVRLSLVTRHPVVLDGGKSLVSWSSHLHLTTERSTWGLSLSVRRATPRFIMGSRFEIETWHMGEGG